MSETTKNAIRGKIIIQGDLTIKTGMHIGGGSDYAPIGAVDSPFIRDSLTQEPIIPGSSLKGKIRTLLARYRSEEHIVNSIDKDDDVIKRLFGSTKPQTISRLQFQDLFISEETKLLFESIDTDTYMGEVKFENTINRVTSVAMPRQIERVPAGTKFAFKLVYTLIDKDEAEEDLQTLRTGLELLQLDYLGGHGTRGYGRISIDNVTIKTFSVDAELSKRCEQVLQG
ncbi:type III-A CRISPR-associated RAMP protein Csm3 [Veillonella sp. VA139]|uniref:type III-A CRISPR-associated RAMP protein Csm3 n=1 Tax=Veillonella sp. VA139 TaxID=741830 RepID=UPI000F8ECE77|nr:type III-A CRISPR-associated RAMP protein Csm3 [Veillonella sp. VA139]